MWAAGRIVERGGIVHLEKGYSYVSFGGRWTPVVTRGRRFAVRTEEVGPDAFGVVAPLTRDADTSLDTALAASVEDYWGQGNGGASSSAAPAAGPMPIPEDETAWEPGDASMGAGTLDAMD